MKETNIKWRIPRNNRLTVTDDDGNVHKAPLLSKTRDMACFSWSIPAGYSCPMAVYGPGSICESCYAMLNRYSMPNVADAQWLRFIWTRHLLKTNSDRWVSIIAQNIDKVCTKGKNAVPFFRWHDSGDLFSLAYILAVTEVCKRTPMVSHWIPTRGWQVKGNPIAEDSKWHAALLELSQLPNVVTRSSALKFDASAPTTPYGPGSTAYTDIDGVTVDDMVELGGASHHACPKSLKRSTIDEHGITRNAGTCAESNCRRCWDPDGGDVAYYVHGWQGKHKPGQLSDTGHAKRAERKARYQALTISAVA